MPRDRSEDEQRRYDAEEERHYWESIEDERREEEQRAAAKDSAIEKMERWFFEHFEDPQVETPRDSEDQSFIYPWGGPFEAGDVLHGAFGGEHPESWITDAAERIERDGTLEWAPISTGDFYEHPGSDIEQEEALSAAAPGQLTASALERLAALEALVANLPAFPAQLGHNGPPVEIGTPPYTEEDKFETIAAIAEARTIVEAPAPDPAELATIARRFDGWGAKIGLWLAKKGDVAVDEFVKNSVRVVIWTKAVAAFAAAAVILRELANAI
jgi:hypothetical protein